MRVRVDDISFESPAGLEDCSAYGFEAPGEQFDLQLEFPAGGETPTDQVIAELQVQLEGFPVPAFSLEAPSDRVVAGVAGKQLRYSFAQDGETVHCVTVVANLGSETHAGDSVKLNWRLQLPRAEADARVDAVLASLARTGQQPGPAAPPPEWVRRCAGIWAFDLPAELSHPRTHTWMDLDARVTMAITVTELGAESPPLDEPLISAADRGHVVVSREDVPITNGELMWVHLRDDELEAERCVCRGVQAYELPDPNQAGVQPCYVVVDAVAPWPAAARLRGLVDDLLASVVTELRS